MGGSLTDVTGIAQQDNDEELSEEQLRLLEEAVNDGAIEPDFTDLEAD